MNNKNFASDNSAGVHSAIFKELVAANKDHAIAYGYDEYTKKTKEIFQKKFGKDMEVFFVYGGTGANVAALSCLLRSYEAVVCAETAHIHMDECGAIENFSGSKLLTIPSKDGKITPQQIIPFLIFKNIAHHVQPKVISITQPTEYGTVYSLDELKKLSEFAKKNGLYLHVDGARFSNAAAHLGLSLKEISKDVGIDVLCLGGTKNGMMYGEAVIFFDLELSQSFQYFQKQSMQLPSKMRFIAAQFYALFSTDLWLKNALKANKNALYFAEKLISIKEVTITQKVEANAVFAQLPKNWIEPLQKKSFFYVWNNTEVRWMCSYDTDERDIENFIEYMKTL